MTTQISPRRGVFIGEYVFLGESLGIALEADLRYGRDGRVSSLRGRFIEPAREGSICSGRGTIRTKGRPR